MQSCMSHIKTAIVKDLLPTFYKMESQQLTNINFVLHSIAMIKLMIDKNFKDKKANNFGNRIVIWYARYIS